VKTALTIAGSDPTGGAGLQADLKVFNALGVLGLSAVSALTAQNTEGVDSIFPVDKDAFEKQLRVLLTDIRPDALKAGMLYSTWAVEITRVILKEFSLTNLVIDPVTVSSSGTSLVDGGTLDSIKDILFPFARVITPNIYEASVLTGIMIEDKKGMEEAAALLKHMGPDVVVITGGHLNEKAIDLFYDGHFYPFEGKKIPGQYHGTGCTFSAAVAAFLACDYSPFESVRKAKDFVFNAIKGATRPGRGMNLLSL
jgi:hydroxymethylpyrimidine/phosphomethylpyrimidine kinase